MFFKTGVLISELNTVRNKPLPEVKSWTQITPV